jgi:hypothetical protein
MSSRPWILAATVLATTAFGIPPVWSAEDDAVPLMQSRLEIPEEELLDVGIQLFDPGLPADSEELYELEQKGVFPDVRKSEARYIPFLLMRTMQSTGYWGAVRLVPAANPVDVMVTGTILESTGKDLELEIQVVDSRGKRWMRERYKREASPASYLEKRDGLARPDPYQSLYHHIANDILEQRNKQDEEDIAEIRMVSQLKFAADLAPTPFAAYLKVDKGSYAIKKLPTRDDPMMRRVTTVRERDYMFIDTLTEYYAGFYSKMDEPYDSWRAFSYEEQKALDQLRKERLWKTILGAAMVAGGVMHEGRGRGVLIAGGTMVVMDAQKSEESKMHLESLRELSASLDADVAPLLIDVEGDVMRLTGSVETQYETWRSLLRTIFATETGLPLDPNLEKPMAESGLSKP